ncbi:MAG: hypothetical protein JJE45_02275 [Prolixibacteraceae bacterium]|nr:hypothetical protein [Prolixibacteraceae bacterium]
MKTEKYQFRGIGIKTEIMEAISQLDASSREESKKEKDNTNAGSISIGPLKNILKPIHN